MIRVGPQSEASHAADQNDLRRATQLRSRGWHSWAEEGRDSTVNHNVVWLTNNLVPL
jgi:hypothetical protein